jgi:diguanylate cyclase (GGDEF)-like protein
VQNPVDRPERSESASEPAVVLIVDDLADNRNLLSRRLLRRGYTVLEAASGPEALAIVAARRVDLVLLDVMMPEMSGNEVLARLRERASPQELAIIMVTARDASTEVAAALDGGANDYLTKPVDFKILEARVNAQLRQMAAAREMRADLREAPRAALFDADALDTLTGLFSRRAFEAKVSRCLVNARRADSGHAVVVLDIDDFRLVNAAYGQAAGDRVLQEVAAILLRFVGDENVAARLGAGEFGLLLFNCDARRARARLRELRQIVRQNRIVWRDLTITTTVSMGVVLVGAQDSSVSDVLRSAALTCEAAKQFGKDQLRIYDKRDGSVSAIQQQADWAVKLQRALRQDQMILYAQPIVAAGDRHGGPVAYEILVRMLDRGEIVPPFYFLAAAEAHGLMPELDRWVLDRTVAMLTAGGSSYCAASRRTCINLSGHSIASERFLRFARDLIGRSGIDPQLICFEVTETAAIQRLDQAKEFIRSFVRMGVRFALDDFGSGVSSFGYLRELAVDFVKIDGRFVRNIEASPIDRAIVGAVNEIAHVLGKQTVAEFVESEEAVVELASMPVDFLQGYHIGKPMPFEDLMRVPPALEQSRA